MIFQQNKDVVRNIERLGLTSPKFDTKSDRAQVRQGPSQTGPKSDKAQVRQGPSQVWPKSDRAQVIEVRHGPIIVR